MDRYNFVSAVVCGTRELVSDIDTQTTSILQNAVAFCPNSIQVIDVLFVSVVETDLIVTSIILQLPIWR